MIKCKIVQGFVLVSKDAVTLTGLSEYAVPGSDFTLKCDVPEEANQVQLYRRLDVNAKQGSIHVDGDQCYNTINTTTTTTTRVTCSPDVCSCTTTSTNYGKVFRWVIQPQSGDHESLWYCRRTNTNLTDALETSPDYTLNVADGPGTVTMSPSTIYYTKTERDTLPDITCTAECRPRCTFVWTKLDNTIFTASYVLSLGQLNRSEHGTYICTARNVVGELTSHVYVFVMYGPSAAGLLPPATSYTFTEGQTLSTVTCSSDCNLVCTYRWTKDGQSHKTGSGLQLTNIQRGQAGMYRCTASNEYGSQTSSDVTVIVNYGPDTVTLSPPGTTYTRTEGDTLPDITCTADCKPGCSFVWTKPDDTNFTASDVLSLGQLDRSEHGTYRCTARNLVRELTTATSVTILFTPEIDSLDYNQGDADVTEHGSKTLICKVESVPSSTITWYYKDNDTQLLTSIGVLESTYTLTTAGCLDTGPYTCSAQNSVSNTSVTKDIMINVLCSPRLDPRVFAVRKIGLATRHNLTMNAMFLSNPEPSSFTWTFQNSSHNSFTELNDGRDNFVIHNTPFTTNRSALSVGTRTNIQEAWFGVYNVTATNSEGNGTLTFTVAAKVTESSSENSPLIAILGGVGGSVVAIIVIVVIIKKKRRPSRKNTRDEDTEMIGRDRRSDEDDSKDGMKPNILYESSDGLKKNFLYESVDAQPGTSSDYAVVQKPSKGKTGSPDAVYAVVNKPKTEQLENVNDVYAEVKKTKNKLGKGKQQEGKKKQTEFEFKDDNQNGRNFIIHGIENKTDYADVDFTTHADPLQPDNEEDQKPAETKNN